MLTLRVNINDAAALSGIAALKAALAERQGMHEAMAAAAEGTVRNHLQALNSRSPNTGFYGQAAASVEASSDATAAVVTIPHRGMTLRYYGGTVRPGASTSSATGNPTKTLAIPTENVPVRNGRRLAPREAGLLAYVPNRGGDPMTSGFLIEGEEVTNKQGRNKGAKRIAPKEGGRMMFVLRKQTTHAPDPSVLPSISQLLESAGQAAADYIESFNLGGDA